MTILIHMLAGVGALVILCATYYWIAALCAIFSSKKFADKLASEVKRRDENDKQFIMDLANRYVQVAITAEAFSKSVSEAMKEENLKND
jgi:hypothetical protein